MTEISVIAFGHSHLGNLQKSYDLKDADFPPELSMQFLHLWGVYDPFVRDVGGQLVFNEEMEAELIRLARESGSSAFIASLIGSEHFLWAIQAQPRPLDVVLPFAPELPRNPGAELVPYRMLHDMVLQTIRTVLTFCGRLQQITGLPVVLVMPPPPVMSTEIVLDRAPPSLKETMQQTDVPHWTIRYKLWRIWVRVAEELAEKDGVGVFYGPEGVTDADGLLLDDYCLDCVHANERYGLLAWQKLANTLGRGTA